MEASGQLHTPAILLQEKEPQHPLNMTLDGPQSWSGRFREGKSLLLLPEIKSQAIHPIA
jgi:hypothetical protein